MEVYGAVTTPPDDGGGTTPPAPPASVGSFHAIVGAQTIAPHYQLTQENKLVETAKAIREMGSNVIKIALWPDAYGITNANHLAWDFARLVREEPSFRTVLDMDFAHVFMWVETAGEVVDGNGMTDAEAEIEYKRIYALTKTLLESYAGTGKTFYLGHWEGDWRILNDAGSYYDATRVDVPDDRIDGMIRWLNVRQQAVDDAKAEFQSVASDFF